MQLATHLTRSLVVQEEEVEIVMNPCSF